MAKIFVAGGAGYIGSHVVKALLKSGFEVVIYDDLSTGHKTNLFPQAEFIKGDILDFEKLKQSMQGCSGVIFLAGKKAVGESMQNPEKYADNNIIGAINILNAMSANNIKALIFSSSAAVYGNPEYVPVDEKHPIKPLNFYGFTKVETERLMAWYERLKGIKYISLRYFNAAGYDADGDIRGREENPQNLLPIILEAITGQREYLEIFGNDYNTRDGTCVRDYVHVSDLASAHILAMERLLNGGSSVTLNLGSGQGYTVKEVVAAAEKVFGCKVPVKYGPRRAGDPTILTSSSAKAQKELGWHPQYTEIEDIIRTFAKIY